MSAWRDLEAQFQKLEPSMEKARLEHQWNMTSDDWRVGGSVDLESAKRFRALAAEAGALLVSAGATVPKDVAAEQDPARRWYLALWHMAGPHDAPIVGMMSSYAGAGGQTSTARIKLPAKSSAALAHRLEESK